jgi:proteasome lid subunit RPN8/RPN11
MASLKPAIYRALSITPVEFGNAAPILCELTGDFTEIGSAEDNTIVLSDPSVAPRHLAIRRIEGQEHLLINLAEERHQQDPEWAQFKSGDYYWCPRHGRLKRLDHRHRCPVCKRRRWSLWLIRPLSPGDSFNVGSAFRATLVVQKRARTSSQTVDQSRLAYPPSRLFEPVARVRRKLSTATGESRLPTAALPTNDSNLWQWQPPGAPFPIFLHQRVNRLITQHARENRRCEVGGVLLGDVRQDVAGQFHVIVTHALRAEFATETHAHLTFTHKTWLTIHQMHESQYPDRTIVGWYHTHPGWSIFLSASDLFIHRNFFKQPWQIALVIDPSIDQGGFFVWKGTRILDPQKPLEPFRLIEMDGWEEPARSRVRIRLKEASGGGTS